MKTITLTLAALLTLAAHAAPAQDTPVPQGRPPIVVLPYDDYPLTLEMTDVYKAAYATDTSQLTKTGGQHDKDIKEWETKHHLTPKRSH